MEITFTLPVIRTPLQLQAMESYGRGEYSESIVLFQKALEVTESAECWNDLGCSQFACSLYQEAEASFGRAIELDGTYVQAVQNLAALLIGRKQTSRAMHILSRAQKALGTTDRALLTPLIEHCLRDSRKLTQPPFQGGTRAPRILCLVAGFLERGFSEGNAHEAWTLFESLRKSPGFEVSFASLETNISKRIYDAERQIYGVPPGEVAAFVRESSPDVLQVYSPQLYFPVDYGLQHQPTTLTLTSNDPLEGHRPEALDELRHMIDCGRLMLICQSTGNLTCLQRHGIRVAATIPPVMAAPPQRIPHRKDRADFVIGFATAPFDLQHWEARGVPLLLDLAAESPQTRFLLAWRTSPDELQKAVAAKGLKNLTVLAGNLDMEEFYDQVDAVILPFGATWGNHNCPLSAVEGMLRGKPVLATEFVGISDWLQREGAGVVVPPTVEGLRTGLVRLQSELREFSQQARLSARSRFDRAATVAAYRQLHTQMLEKHKGPTLKDWENKLEAVGKTLVRGRPALAKFYEPCAVAEGYMEHRFSSLPWKQFEEQEQNAIKHLVVSRFGARTDLTLLDLATGPGRLVPSLLPFGDTTALDGSEAMLKVARQANRSGVKFVQGDVFRQSLEEKFHVVTCGRLLRHLEYPDRRLLYRRFQELLREDGIAIVEVPNPGPEYLSRDSAGWESSTVYDVFWTLGEFREELNQNGLALVSFVSVGAHLSPQSDQSNPGEPLEYVVAFEKQQACAPCGS